ncbi:heparan sulfate glucosamine 3-O-sulfotransferase 5-like [Dysidea avara]|uniref:heparan sulfate glucosamine 3-O-sulfotransferase 5-like n=1 Tax=Dysidea avara TaxID=196820 RepID=UPI00331C4CDA
MRRCYIQWLLWPVLCLTVIFVYIQSTKQHQPTGSTKSSVTEKSSNNIISKFNQKFPRIFIIGFGKAGTRVLYETLLLHNNVVGPRQEMRFFDEHYNNGFSWYLHKLPLPKPNQQVAEKSPSYILHPEVLGRLITDSKLVGVGLDELKFVVIFRHPIVRAISEYVEWQMLRTQMHQKLLPTFGKVALDSKGKVTHFKPVNHSIYVHYVKQWLKVFSREQFCFVDGDQFAEHPYEVFSQLEKCLGLPPQILQQNFHWMKDRNLFCLSRNNIIKCPSLTKGRPHPFVKENVVDALMDYYKPFNEQLYALTDAVVNKTII